MNGMAHELTQQKQQQQLMHKHIGTKRTPHNTTVTSHI